MGTGAKLAVTRVIAQMLRQDIESFLVEIAANQ
jgi:hypothetical protein